MTAPTTAIRTAVDPMWNLTIRCNRDTSIDGSTRYQWPRIIAVQLPPSSAADERKLAAVSQAEGPASTTDQLIACVTRAATPPSTVVHSSTGRSDARARPMVAQ